MFKKPASSRIRVYGFLLLIAILGAGGYLIKHYMARAASKGGDESQEKKKDAAKDASPVELAEAKRDQISSFLNSTANLRALREIDVASQAEGVVKAVFVEEGDFVKQGQVMCQLDDAELKMRLELAKERLAQARLQQEKAKKRQEKASAQIEHTRKEVTRLQQAYDEKLIAEREVAQAKYRLDEFQHDERIAATETREFTHRVEELEAEIRQVELLISRTQIRAPFSGHVTLRTVELGRTVRNLDALFRLGAFSPLYADVHLSEREAREVRPGDLAIVKLGIDESVKCEGRVERLSPVVDQSSGTVKVTVELTPAAGALKPGAFVRVEIQTDTRQDTVLIPKKSVLEEDGEYYVFIAKGDMAKKAKVSLGYEWSGQVEIRKGVAAGEKIVVAGQGALKDGGKIKVIKG